MLVDEPLELEATAAVKTPSELLVEARQRLGLSQKEVADELYLTTSFIEYIDVGEFASIPNPAFIKGYLRAYARVVELSGDEIVALYRADLQGREPTPEIKRLTEEDVGTASITGPVLQSGLVGLAGLGLIVAVTWWFVSGSEEEPLLSVVQPSALQLAAQGSLGTDLGLVLPSQEGVALESEQLYQKQTVSDQAALALQREGTRALQRIDAIEPAQAETVVENMGVPEIPMAGESIQEAAIEPSVSESSLPEQVSPGVAENSVKSELTSDGTGRFVTVDAGGPDKLELLFSDECWVEIEDNQFGLIYNDLNQANDALTIFGTGPFKVLLGQATGVEMIYNGRQFELEPFVGRDRTAKLVVPN
jgi:cytoskeleton protein RodZ